MGTDNKIISIRQNAGSEPVKNDKLAFGDIIRQYRTELSMSAQELASRVGVSKSAITNWESGIRRPRLSFHGCFQQTVNQHFGNGFIQGYVSFGAVLLR